MIQVNILLEGGSFKEKKKTKQLRDEFRSLLIRGLSTEDFRLIIDARASDNNTVKNFKGYPDNTFLIIDLDEPESTRNERLKSYEIEDSTNRIFFMIQAMEAWVLSQPEVLEKYVAKRYSIYTRRRKEKAIENDAILKDKHPEDIEKPDKKLHTLLGRYFLYSGKKKVKYQSKLTTGADLLEFLDIQKLSETFTDVKKLLEAIETSIQNENKQN